jgi:hypothetical protein
VKEGGGECYRKGWRGGEIVGLWFSLRENMGLLEYQAMPSLRDVAHDG